MKEKQAMREKEKTQGRIHNNDSLNIRFKVRFNIFSWSYINSNIFALFIKPRAWLKLGF